MSQLDSIRLTAWIALSLESALHVAADCKSGEDGARMRPTLQLRMTDGRPTITLH